MPIEYARPLSAAVLVEFAPRLSLAEYHPKQSLQYYLYSMLNSAKALREIQSRSGIVLDVDLPSETSKLAMSMVATGPILLVYPFIQRFFIKGLTVGAVKG